MKNTRITKIITAIIIATIMLTGCSTKAPTVTTETVDVTTYMVIDENEPTVTETVKNDDGTTTIITKTTDGSTVSIATTTTEATTTETEKETEVTTTKATPTETTKATATPTTEVKPTEPMATPTETTKPTTPEPTETTKPTNSPKPTETTKPTDTPKPTETTKPTTQPTKPSEPTTKPSEPTTKPTEPTEPTTPEPVKYEVRIKGNTGGTGTGAGYYKAGETVTITATADSGYHFDYWNNITEGTKATTATYTFTMPEKTLVFKPYFEQDATTPEPTKYYYAEVDVQFCVSFTDADGVFHSNEYLPVKTYTVYSADGQVSDTNHRVFYGYNSTRDAVVQYLTSLYPNATIEGWSHVSTNLRNLRETL